MPTVLLHLAAQQTEKGVAIRVVEVDRLACIATGGEVFNDM